jgi:CTP:molybdopterin cytidylyltransferase MocA
MGIPKALLRCNDDVACAVIARAFRRVGINNILVTLPWDLLWDDNLRCYLQSEGALSIANSFPDWGYLGSVKTALERAQPDCSGIICNPVDAPFLSSHLLSLMLKIIDHNHHKPLILLPAHNHCHGHPIYFSRHFFAAIKDGDSHGLRGIAWAHREHWQVVAWPKRSVLDNFNCLAEINYPEGQTQFFASCP